MPKFSLDGRVAVVTGGAGGMGSGFTKALLEHGASVAIMDLSTATQEAMDVAKKYKGQLKQYRVDVSSYESLKEGFAQVENDFGRLDVFVGSAGINKVVDFLETDWEYHMKLVSVNQIGLYHSAQLAAKLMIKCVTKNGSIILIGGGAGQIAVKSVNTSAYNATKGAVLSMAKSIAKEVGPYGIRCNSLSPGYTKTLMTKDYPELLAQWAKESMLGRVGEIDDVAGACIFLASDASHNVTGIDLLADGGAVAW